MRNSAIFNAYIACDNIRLHLSVKHVVCHYRKVYGRQPFISWQSTILINKGRSMHYISCESYLNVKWTSRITWNCLAMVREMTWEKNSWLSCMLYLHLNQFHEQKDIVFICLTFIPNTKRLLLHVFIHNDPRRWKQFSDKTSMKKSIG